MVVKENLLIKPSSVDPKMIGQLEGHLHQATILFLDEMISAEDLIVNIREWLSAQEGVAYGVSEFQVKGLVVRLLGHKARQLYDCLLQISDKFLSKDKTSPVQLKSEIHGA